MYSLGLTSGMQQDVGLCGKKECINDVRRRARGQIDRDTTLIANIVVNDTTFLHFNLFFPKNRFDSKNVELSNQVYHHILLQLVIRSNKNNGQNRKNQTAQDLDAILTVNDRRQRPQASASASLQTAYVSPKKHFVRNRPPSMAVPSPKKSNPKPIQKSIQKPPTSDACASTSFHQNPSAKLIPIYPRSPKSGPKHSVTFRHPISSHQSSLSSHEDSPPATTYPTSLAKLSASVDHYQQSIPQSSFQQLTPREQEITSILQNSSSQSETQSKQKTVDRYSNSPEFLQPVLPKQSKKPQQRPQQKIEKSHHPKVVSSVDMLNTKHNRAVLATDDEESQDSGSRSQDSSSPEFIRTVKSPNQKMAQGKHNSGHDSGCATSSSQDEQRRKRAQLSKKVLSVVVEEDEGADDEEETPPREIQVSGGSEDSDIIEVFPNRSDRDATRPPKSRRSEKKSKKQNRRSRTPSREPSVVIDEEEAPPKKRTRRRLKKEKDPMDVGTRRHKMRRFIHIVYGRPRPVKYKMKALTIKKYRALHQKRTRVTRQISNHIVPQYHREPEKGKRNVPEYTVAETVESYLDVSKTMMQKSSKHHDELVAVGVDYDNSVKMLHFGRTMKKHSCKQKRLKFQMSWWPKDTPDEKLKRKGGIRTTRITCYTPYRIIDDPYLFKNHWSFCPKSNAPLQVIRKYYLKPMTRRRTTDDIILDTSYFVREFYLGKAFISLRVTRSSDIPYVYVPPIMQCGYYPYSAVTVENKKFYLAARFREAQLEYFNITYRDIKPWQGFKVGTITDSELYYFHCLGKHIHGFWLIWEKIGRCNVDKLKRYTNRRYLVDMFNFQFFPLDVDIKKWELRLRIAFDTVTAYNLHLAEVLRINKPVFDSLTRNPSFYKAVTLKEIVHLMLEQGINPKYYMNSCGKREFYNWGLEKTNEDYLSAYFIICGGSKIIKDNRKFDLEHTRAHIDDQENTAAITRKGEVLHMHIPMTPSEILVHLDNFKYKKNFERLIVHGPMTPEEQVITNLIADTPRCPTVTPQEAPKKAVRLRTTVMTRKELMQVRNKIYQIPKPKKVKNKPQKPARKKPGRKPETQVDKGLKKHDFDILYMASDIESDYENYLSGDENYEDNIPKLTRSQSSESIFADIYYTDYQFDKVSGFHRQRINHIVHPIAQRKKRKMNRHVKKHLLRYRMLALEGVAFKEMLECYHGNLPKLGQEITKTKKAIRVNGYKRFKVPKVFEKGDSAKIDSIGDLLKEMVTFTVAAEHSSTRAANGVARIAQRGRIMQRLTTDNLKPTNFGLPALSYLAMEILTRVKMTGRTMMEEEKRNLRESVNQSYINYMSLLPHERRLLDAKIRNQKDRHIALQNERYETERMKNLSKRQGFIRYDQRSLQAQHKREEARRLNRLKHSEKETAFRKEQRYIAELKAAGGDMPTKEWIRKRIQEEEAEEAAKDRKAEEEQRERKRMQEIEAARLLKEKERREAAIEKEKLDEAVATRLLKEKDERERKRIEMERIQAILRESSALMKEAAEKERQKQLEEEKRRKDAEKSQSESEEELRRLDRQRHEARRLKVLEREKKRSEEEKAMEAMWLQRQKELAEMKRRQEEETAKSLAAVKIPKTVTTSLYRLAQKLDKEMIAIAEEKLYSRTVMLVIRESEDKFGAFLRKTRDFNLRVFTAYFSRFFDKNRFAQKNSDNDLYDNIAKCIHYCPTFNDYKFVLDMKKIVKHLSSDMKHRIKKYMNSDPKGSGSESPVSNASFSPEYEPSPEPESEILADSLSESDDADGPDELLPEAYETGQTDLTATHWSRSPSVDSQDGDESQNSYKGRCFHPMVALRSTFWRLIEMSENALEAQNEQLYRNEFRNYIVRRRSFRKAGVPYAVGVYAASCVLLTGSMYDPCGRREQSPLRMPGEVIEIDNNDPDLKGVIDRVAQLGVVFHQANRSPLNLKQLCKWNGFRQACDLIDELYEFIMGVYCKLQLDQVFKDELDDETKIREAFRFIATKFVPLLSMHCGVKKSQVAKWRYEEVTIGRCCVNMTEYKQPTVNTTNEFILKQNAQQFSRITAIVNWYQYLVEKGKSKIEDMRSNAMNAIAWKRRQYHIMSPMPATSDQEEDDEESPIKIIIPDDVNLLSPRKVTPRTLTPRTPTLHVTKDFVIDKNNGKDAEASATVRHVVSPYQHPFVQNIGPRGEVCQQQSTVYVSGSYNIPSEKEKYEKKIRYLIERREEIEKENSLNYNIPPSADMFINNLWRAIERRISVFPGGIKIMTGLHKKIQRPHILDSEFKIYIMSRDARGKRFPEEFPEYKHDWFKYTRISIEPRKYQAYEDTILNSFPHEIMCKKKFRKMQWTVPRQFGPPKKAIEFFTDLDKYRDLELYKQYLSEGELPFNIKIYRHLWFMGSIFAEGIAEDWHDDGLPGGFCGACTDGTVIFVKKCTCIFHQDHYDDKFIYTHCNIKKELNGVERLTGRFVCEHGPSLVLVLVDEDKRPKGVYEVKNPAYTTHDAKLRIVARKTMHAQIRKCFANVPRTIREGSQESTTNSDSSGSSTDSLQDSVDEFGNPLIVSKVQPNIVENAKELYKRFSRLKEGTITLDKPKKMRTWRSKSVDSYRKAFEVKHRPGLTATQSLIDLTDLENHAKMKMEKAKQTMIEELNIEKDVRLDSETMDTRLFEGIHNISEANNFRLLLELFTLGPAAEEPTAKYCKTRYIKIQEHLKQHSLMRVYGQDKENVPRFEEDKKFQGGQPISALMHEYYAFMQYIKRTMRAAKNHVAANRRLRFNDAQFEYFHMIYQKVFNLNLHLFEHLLHQISKHTFTPYALHHAEHKGDLTKIRTVLARMKIDLPTVMNSFFNIEPMKRQIHELRQLSEFCQKSEMDCHIATLGRYAIERIRVPQSAEKVFDDYPWINQSVHKDTIDLLRFDSGETVPDGFDSRTFNEQLMKNFYNPIDVFEQSTTLRPKGESAELNLYNAFYTQCDGFFAKFERMMPHGAMDPKMKTYHQHQAFIRLYEIAKGNRIVDRTDVTRMNDTDVIMLYTAFVSNPDVETDAGADLDCLNQLYMQLSKQKAVPCPINPSLIGTTFVVFDHHLVVSMVREPFVFLADLHFKFTPMRSRGRIIEAVSGSCVINLLMDSNSDKIRIEMRPKSVQTKGDRLCFELDHETLARAGSIDGVLKIVVSQRFNKLQEQFEMQPQVRPFKSRRGILENRNIINELVSSDEQDKSSSSSCRMSERTIDPNYVGFLHTHKELKHLSEVSKNMREYFITNRRPGSRKRPVPPASPHIPPHMNPKRIRFSHKY
ncbi:hypothetical protein L3Y34_011019 [Caenorhabditis briggsae]|uniref:Protein CBR-SDC-2 n=2 Tax=Caenorhabditis briggsae TaxID=6238 RepID=A0AAE8ZQC4_CAEBR|nr:hypothetical protein L3Y34_011019 [Caenorhabditis briggsae]